MHGASIGAQLPAKVLETLMSPAWYHKVEIVLMIILEIQAELLRIGEYPVDRAIISRANYMF